MKILMFSDDISHLKVKGQHLCFSVELYSNHEMKQNNRLTYVIKFCEASVKLDAALCDPVHA